MSNISYNGTTFEEMGVKVEKIPPIIKGKQRFKQYTIPGRDGILWIDEGTYEPFTITLECHYDNDIIDTDDITKWLNNDGKLSLDGVRYYDAFINNAIEFEKVQYFRKFLISFLCNPISYEIEEEVFEFEIPGDTSQTLNYYGNTKTWPIIEIKGSGQLIVNFASSYTSSGFTLNASGNDKYIIDCRAKEITQDGVNKSADMNGEFPFIPPESVLISVSGTGTLTSLKVKYHTAWL